MHARMHMLNLIVPGIRVVQIGAKTIAENSTCIDIVCKVQRMI